MIPFRLSKQDAALTSDARVQVKVGDLAAQLPTLMAAPFDAIFHLAAAVSGECEADFELGMHARHRGLLHDDPGAGR